ncbi:hypothetical protein [Streptomyces sp. NPDC014733]|uniref:hypothetical protein n=1 Tax=Streptomyces sp. NPDC014733 TaxID=3364885 RepID=UPI0036FDB88F
MQIALTVVVLLALIALGVLFLARVNAQQAGRMATHKYATLQPSFRLRMRRWPHGGGSRPGPHAAGPPPPTPGERGDGRPGGS